MGDQVQQGVAARGDALRQGVEPGRPQGAGQRGEQVVGNLAQGGGDIGRQGGGIEMGEAEGVSLRRVGQHHQGAQVAAAQGGEAPVGEARQVAGVGGALVQRQEIPTAQAIRGAQAFPAQGLEGWVLHHQ